ncbi:MAG: 3-isopropylmalate dehydratase small subunit [Deltaproteobacteria bacterium]|nr:3-isopropylmalate dehydratase small subunit [Deltaproteobacteria bacterium]
MKYTGTVHAVGDHIDTDAIIPAKYLVTPDPEILGRNLFDGLEAGWVSRVTPGDILVAGANFGCGSSREHAPLAILGAGIPVVLARSFARIFYRNAFNMGLPLIELGEDATLPGDGDRIEVDMARGRIRNLISGRELSFSPVPAFMQSILDQGGLVGHVRSRLQGVHS